MDGMLEIDQKVLAINTLCAQAEYEMGVYYARKIIASNNPKEELLAFLYYQNYLDLTRLEYFNASFFREIQKALFLWWWPLPLTFILLAQQYHVHSVIVDNNPEAISLASELIESLELSAYIDVVYWDARDYTDTREYDICSVASLIFSDSDHDSILSSVSRLDFHILLARTAEWYRQLIYQKIDESIFKKYFRVQTIIHPKNHIINSVIFSTKKSHA